MATLIDNDVFFAAMYTGHQNHSIARSWLDQAKPKGWAVATETWLAAMRLFMNPALLGPSRLNGSQCWKIVNAECSGLYPATVVRAKKPPQEMIFSKATGHRQIMDFWLVQLARQEKMTLATFDQALNKHWPEHVQLLS